MQQEVWSPRKDSPPTVGMITNVVPLCAAVGAKVAPVLTTTRFNPPPAGVIVPLTTKLPAIVVVMGAGPPSRIAIGLVAAAAICI